MRCACRYGNYVEHRDLARIVDLRKSDDIHGIGRVDHGVLTTYHVTDEPDAIIALIKRRARLMAAYGAKGQTAELGPGLYASGNPEYWLNRSRGKWDFLKGASRSTIEKLVSAVRSNVESQRRFKHISSGEYESAMRQLRYIDEGDLEPTNLANFSNQPYNIPIWKPEYLAELGIKPGRAPRLLELKLTGELAELSRSHPDPAVLRTLRRAGVAGAFTRASMATNPEIVIWDVAAIRRVREVPFD